MRWRVGTGDGPPVRGSTLAAGPPRSRLTRRPARSGALRHRRRAGAHGVADRQAASSCASRSPPEVGLHERVEVAVEHGVDVAGLVLGPQVLDHLVRLQHVGADLAAEADLGLAAAGDGVQLLLALLARPRPAWPSRICMARSLFWCWLRSFWQDDDDAGREVGDAHGRVGHVDVLAAGARRAVGVDAQVLLVDLDVAASSRTG